MNIDKQTETAINKILIGQLPPIVKSNIIIDKQVEENPNVINNIYIQSPPKNKNIIIDTQVKNKIRKNYIQPPPKNKNIIIDKQVKNKIRNNYIQTPKNNNIIIDKQVENKIRKILLDQLQTPLQNNKNIIDKQIETTITNNYIQPLPAAQQIISKINNLIMLNAEEIIEINNYPAKDRLKILQSYNNTLIHLLSRNV
jgi:hypothetical protein